MNDNTSNDNDRDNLTLNKFEAFINGLDVPGVTIKADQQPLADAVSAIGALISDKPSITPSIAEAARLHMQAALMRAIPDHAAYFAELNDDQRELMYIEHMRRCYGNELVDGAINDARTSYRTFYHALQLRIMTQRLNTDFDKLRDAFASFGKAISDQIARGFADVKIDQPLNREERRSAKYGTRRMQESDQKWARRYRIRRRR